MAHAATPQRSRRVVSSLQRLDAYRLSLLLTAAVDALVPRGHSALRDQLDRAASSVSLCVAEGFGRWQTREKAHLNSVAHGSALEVRAVIDVLAARGLASSERCEAARALATRVARVIEALVLSVRRRL